jgi:REP element-mobilizing transposase RayT
VHLLLSIPPSLSVSRAVQYLKGRSSHKLRRRPIEPLALQASRKRQPYRTRRQGLAAPSIGAI